MLRCRACLFQTTCTLLNDDSSEKKMEYKVINLKTIDSGYAGKLSFFEGTRDFPFEIKRFYYIHGVPNGSQRGGHAHRQLRQMLFCPYGSIEILLDDSIEKVSVLLDDPSKGLVIGPGLWRDMVWHQEDSVLCVAASEFYDEKDYIRSYDAFLQYKKSQKGESANG